MDRSHGDKPGFQMCVESSLAATASTKGSFWFKAKKLRLLGSQQVKGRAADWKFGCCRM